MQEDSGTQPNVEDHPTFLSHSDLPQQHGTSPVDLPTTQENVRMVNAYPKFDIGSIFIIIFLVRPNELWQVYDKQIVVC